MLVSSINSKITARLKKTRENNYISQRKTAQKLKISKSYYNYFETGERIITVSYLNDFCNLFHTTFDYILGLSNYNISTKKKYKINRELVSKRIKSVRKNHKLSQKALAKLMNTSQSTISAYENGKSLIITAFLFEMCSKLNISADYIIGRSNTIKIYIKEESSE